MMCKLFLYVFGSTQVSLELRGEGDLVTTDFRNFDLMIGENLPKIEVSSVLSYQRPRNWVAKPK